MHEKTVNSYTKETYLYLAKGGQIPSAGIDCCYTSELKIFFYTISSIINL